MYGVGTGLIVASFSSFLSEAPGPGYPGYEDPGPDKALVLGIAGAVMLRIPFFLNNPKQKYMNQALEAY